MFPQTHPLNIPVGLLHNSVSHQIRLCTFGQRKGKCFTAQAEPGDMQIMDKPILRRPEPPKPAPSSQEGSQTKEQQSDNTKRAPRNGSGPSQQGKIVQHAKRGWQLLIRTFLLHFASLEGLNTCCAFKLMSTQVSQPGVDVREARNLQAQLDQVPRQIETGSRVNKTRPTEARAMEPQGVRLDREAVNSRNPQPGMTETGQTFLSQEMTCRDSHCHKVKGRAGKEMPLQLRHKHRLLANLRLP